MAWRRFGRDCYMLDMHLAWRRVRRYLNRIIEWCVIIRYIKYSLMPAVTKVTYYYKSGFLYTTVVQISRNQSLYKQDISSFKFRLMNTRTITEVAGLNNSSWFIALLETTTIKKKKQTYRIPRLVNISRLWHILVRTLE